MRQSAPAALRNRQPILEALLPLLPESGLAVEIASGTGEHAVHFAGAAPTVQWQPTDISPHAIASINTWQKQAALANLLPAVVLDAAADSWPIGRADVVININMVHIAPWEACLGLLRGAARVLPAGGLLFMYGPYFIDDQQAAPSNIQFDRSLRARDPSWGVRRLADVAAAAELCGLQQAAVVAMPANNVSVIYRRD